MKSDDQLPIDPGRHERPAGTPSPCSQDDAETARRLAMTLDDLEDAYHAEASRGSRPDSWRTPGAVGANAPDTSDSGQGTNSSPHEPKAATSTVDRILDILDTGLQQPIGKAPGHTTAPPGMCARCQNHRRTGPDADLCPGCRAYLLGDSDYDRTGRWPTVGLFATPQGPGRAIRAPEPGGEHWPWP